MEKNEKGYSEYNFGNRSTGNAGGCCGGCRGGCTDGGSAQGGANGGMCDSDFGGAKRQLAMVYSPHQCWRGLYSPDEALKHGTLFEELYKPLTECGNGK